jgi:hypothetical protein
MPETPKPREMTLAAIRNRFDGGGWDSADCKWLYAKAEQHAELLETVIAYRLHHKLLLNVTDDVDCPCKICQMAEDVIRKAKGN